MDAVVVLVVQLVSRHSCVADRLPVVVRFSAGPRVRLKTVDPPKGKGLGQKKVEKMDAVVARNTFRIEHVKRTTCSRHFWTFRCRFAWQAQKGARREGIVAFPKTMAGVGHLNRICKDAFSVASEVQETCSSELLGGPGADFLRGVAFWSLRGSFFGTMIIIEINTLFRMFGHQIGEVPEESF